jgi:hypothetical protein
MQYVLGNMLNGAGGLNADGLALDLQFAADKTLTARKGPTPVFTRASTGTFVGSDGLIQSAAVNAARFDHTSAGVCRGLLIEESRTNIWTRSEGLDANPWFPVNTTTITSNNAIAPDGATTAERITVGAITQAYGVFNNQISFVNGTSYAVSCFFKADQVTRVAIQCTNTAILPVFAIFELTGSGSVIGTPTGTASIQELANGWYRCSVSATTLSSGTTSVRFCAVSGTSLNYTGNSVDSFWAWGAQNEVGSFPTSYIPTVASSVVRSADVCSISGGNFTSLWNPSEGTLLADATPQPVSQVAFVLTANTTSTNNQNAILKANASLSGNGLRWAGVTNNSSGVNQASIVTSTDVATARAKLSYAYKLNDFSFAYNGAIVGTDNSGTTSSPTVLHIGCRDGALPLNGHLAFARYYRKRLSDAKQIALTT